VVRGCITTGTPYEAVSTPAVTNDASPQTATISTLGPDRLVACLLAHDDDTTFSSGYPPATWTNNSRLTSATGTQAGFAFLSKTKAAAGSESGVTIGTLATAEAWSSLTLGFIPPPDPFKPTPTQSLYQGVLAQ
jgi:hypothetical protein